MSPGANGISPADFTLAHPVLAPAEPAAASERDLPHILLLLDQFPKTLGGGERIVLRLAALLPAYGFRVSILTFAIHPESAVRSFPIPCPIYLLPLERTYDLTALRAARSFGRFLKRHDIRLVQTFFESSDLWGGAVVRLLSTARLVWSRRDMGILRGRKHRIAYRLLAAMPHRVFAVSEQVRQHVVDVDGVNPAKVQVVYNGLDLEQFGHTPRTSPPGGEFRIVTVGNVREVKGHDILLRAAISVLERFPDVSFWVAGEILEPGYFAALQEQTAAAGVGAHFHFVHDVRDTVAFLRDAHLFVLPSRSEGFSNALLEAMAAALPVVAADVGGNAEAIEEGKTGLLVPANDPAALALALTELLNEPARMLSMGEAGRSRVVELFTAQAMMQAVSRSYTTLLAKPHGQRR